MIQRIENILCPVDFSEFSALALEYASAIAQHYNAALVVYHSLPGGTPSKRNIFRSENNRQKYAYHDLEKFVKENAIYPLDTKNIIETGGQAVEGILRTAKQQKADLIIMGTRGLGGLRHLLTGSVTNRVLQGAEIPVVTICKPQRNFIPVDTAEQFKIRRILCAVDPRHANIKIVDTALSLARSYQSVVYFLEVEEHVGQETMLESLRSIIRPEKEDWCDVEFITRSGDPVQEILKAAEELKADLIIMGHHTRNFPDMLGSVTLRVVPTAPCPVMVLPFNQVKQAIQSEHIPIESAMPMQMKMM